MVSTGTGQASVDVRLRDVLESDIPSFFEHQLDPRASAMTGFPARDWETFAAHWVRIRGDATVVTRTVLADGQVAGNVVSFEHAGRREVGYWIGSDYWGRGVATRALALFLEQERTRPLFAGVARQNAGSRRVLEKCGFTFSAEDDDEFTLKLA
jgi:RimJ/RimL family protein N-acetyltransferase